MKTALGTTIFTPVRYGAKRKFSVTIDSVNFETTADNIRKGVGSNSKTNYRLLHVLERLEDINGRIRRYGLTMVVDGQNIQIDEV